MREFRNFEDERMSKAKIGFLILAMVVIAVFGTGGFING